MLDVGRPLVVIGLDGATWRLIDRWIEDGELPNLASIKRQGTWAPQQVCLPPVTSPNWKCYSTGKNPGKLGVYWWEIVNIKDRSITTPDSTSYDSAELWDYLGREGYTVGIVNMPTTFPPHKVNGVMISRGASNDQQYTYPKHIKETIERNFDYRPIPTLSLRDRETGSVDEVLNLIDRRFEVAEWLLDEYNLDFLHVTVFLCNKLQHYYWDEEPTLCAWRRIDKNLYRFFNRDLNLLFMSDHGSNEITTEFQANAWLEREGFLSRKDDLNTKMDDIGSQLGFTQRGLSNLANSIGLREVIRRTVPDSIINRLPKKGYSNESKLDVIDWEKTDAIASGQGLIYLTDPSSESISISQNIIERLRELEDPNTGEQVARKVYRKEEVYSGDHLNLAPDIIFDQSPGVHTAQAIGNFEPFSRPTNWRGENERDGIFLAHGPNFRSRGEIKKVRIVDLMPTILTLMNTPIPTDLDGEVLDVLTDDVTKDPPTQTPMEPPERLIYSRSDERDVRENLEELGYLN